MLKEIEKRLLELFAEDGAATVHWVVAFPMPGAWAWIFTDTDQQRDAIVAKGLYTDEVRAVLGESGFDRDDLDASGCVVESMETVNRDFEGSVFYRLR